ncbi:MAG: glycosyltransferase family 2 protein [Candidatus Omnitrophica bacterium]|jgi:hypothetical protein|nr:glycosyltransferase family 2 protein [Candidatus Omnitrophota bacterium]
MKISFIILTWNSANYIARCLESIFGKCAAENIDYEVIVIDNGSKDGTGLILTHYATSITKISLDRNMGTTRTRNLGLKHATGDIICFLDSDTEILKGSLSEACRLLLSDERIGILAPRLIMPDGSVQQSVKRFPSLWNKLCKLKSILGSGKAGICEYYTSLPADTAVTVDSAISACWFFKKSLTDLIGLLDERIFYAPEDIDYCLRSWKAGKGVIYYPRLEILHHTQQINHVKPFNALSLSHLAGLLYYFAKHRYIIHPPAFGEWNKLDKGKS